MDQKPIKVLFIEDNPGDVRLIRELLKEIAGTRFELQHADRLSRGLICLTEGAFDVILLDLGLPDSQGLDTLSIVCAQRPKAPIVVLTGLADEMVGIEAIHRGAQDYLAKGKVNGELLVRTIRYAIERYVLLRELERTTHNLEQTVEELRNANKRIKDQQKSVIEEERLKVLLQMAGATAHELSQPLTGLLAGIELMRLKMDDPEKLAQYMHTIEETGQRISHIVRRIQTIRHDETKPYVGGSSIINLYQDLNILSVEDEDAIFDKVHNSLKDSPHITLSRAGSIREAIPILKNNRFDLVLLNHVLPDGDSLDFLRVLADQGLELPVVVVTARGNEMIATKVIRAGACDYLPSDSISKGTLSESIYNAMENFRLKREANLALRKMAQMATRDELTGVYNRRFFVEALEREMTRAKRYGTDLVILMIDLDYFKRVNDTYGHTAGDMVLREIGKMLLDSMRQSDLICRYGGEEFAVILPNTDVEKATVVSERFRERVSKHQFEHDSQKLQITVSIGIASFDRSSDDQSPTELVDNADQALYQAKREGRNRVKGPMISIDKGVGKPASIAIG